MPNLEITGELIKSAVAQKILSVIPEAAGRVYKEPQNQNINGDAFYISERRIRQSAELLGMYSRSYEMIIRYEPDIEAARKAEKSSRYGTLLLMALIAVDPGNGVLIHGRDMSVEVVDDVALIYVTYTIRIKTREDNQNPMDDLTIHKEVL